MQSVRAVVLGAAFLCFAPSDTHASVSIAVTFDTLVERADAAMTVTPIDANSVWEGKRIVTYTRLRVDRSIAGQGASEVVVKTLGGSVGELGQSVSGEPHFMANESSIVFLRKVDQAYMVVERAQGQYPVALDKAKNRWMTKRASDIGSLVPPEPAAATPAVVATGKTLAPTRYAGSLAHDVLINRPVDDVAQDIIDAWPKRHPLVVPGATKGAQVTQ
jgi:hypothetical protein